MDEMGVLEMDSYKNLLSDKTKVVAVNHISNALGTINPVKQMIQWAHEVGAAVLIDGAQAGPHCSIDVQDLRRRFLLYFGTQSIWANRYRRTIWQRRMVKEIAPLSRWW